MDKIDNKPNWNIGIVGGMSIGKDFYGDGSDYDFEYLEKEMFVDIEKGSTILVIASATNDGPNRNQQEEYTEVLRKKLTENGYNCIFLKSSEFSNKERIKELLQSSAVAIELGGNTLAMVGYWNATGFSKSLIEAINNGMKYIGISAGAIALFSKGLSDSYISEGLSNDYYFVDGIGYFQNTLLVPHYSSRKNDKIMQMIIEEPDKPIINIPNGVTLLIDEQNGLYKFIEQPNRNIVYDNETPSVIFPALGKRDFQIQKIGLLNEIILFQENKKFTRK
ncbi:MAG: Type 1 glutamine amidotransferase-like domain-containing protein [Bacilli bacterium]|nr:Type 1 glutamine amidotransferase-like domain-containing protein [Bacilli bacterium]